MDISNQILYYFHIMQFFNAQRWTSKRRLAYLVRIFLNTIHYTLENYVVNKLNNETINNDLGASFTAILRKKGRVIKRADPAGEDKLRDEIEWILSFQKTKLRRYLPKIFNYSLEKGNVFYEMKYYDYPNLRRIIINEMNPRFFIRQRLLHLMELITENLWIPENSTECPKDFVLNEYFDKFSKRRLEAEKTDPFFKLFYESPVLSVNGKRLLNAPVLLDAIRNNTEAFNRLSPEKLYISHGDLHCNNILCGVGYARMVLIDCRGKSSAGIPYFDPAYDIAKLFHDFHGMYSLIERHSYSIFYYPEKEPRIEYQFIDKRAGANFRKHYAFLRAIAHRNITNQGNLLERADFAEALLFLTMIPMHMKKRDEALMCYTTGVKLLNDWCNKYRKNLSQELKAIHTIVD